MKGFRWLCLSLCWGFAACGGGRKDETGNLYGSCTIVTGSSSGTSKTCVEFPSLTAEDAAAAKNDCETAVSGAVRTWAENRTCEGAGRIGRCTNTSNGLTSTTWTYTTGNEDGDSIARGKAEQSCTSGENADGPGTWSAIYSFR